MLYTVVLQRDMPALLAVFCGIARLLSFVCCLMSISIYMLPSEAP